MEFPPTVVPGLVGAAGFAGERLAIAELGRLGTFLAARLALFCAAICSLSDVLDATARTLPAPPAPWPTLLVKEALLALGLPGSFSNKPFDFASRPSMILRQLVLSVEIRY